MLVRGHRMSVAETNGAQFRFDVVGIAAVVAVDAGMAVSFVRVVHRHMGSIGRQLLVIGSETIAGSVGVSKHASLKD